MLHGQTLSPSALDLLKALCAHVALRPFALAGGTSLALRFGHRLSVDLDFFTSEPFDNENLAAELRQDFALDERRRGSTGITAYIAGVKVDLVKYAYPFMEPPEVIDGIRLASLPDVVAMKLSAVTNRGAKKDFYDLHWLIREQGLPHLIETYQKKFPQTDSLMMLRSLGYFADAEDEEEPVSLKGVTWPEVKHAITAAVREML
jgi:predicted nucleotidyltransferase component of viral defense system